MEWIPGKNHGSADTLSRNPLFDPPEYKEIIIRQVTEEIEDKALVDMSKIATADKTYQAVVDIIRSGTHDGKKIKNLRKSHPAQQHRSQWDSLAVRGGGSF